MTVHRFEHTDMLRNIGIGCQSLQTLEILSLPSMLSGSLIEFAQSAVNLKKVVIHTDVTTETAAQILRYRPTLEQLELYSLIDSHNVTCFGQYPNLRSVQLRPKKQNPREGPNSISSLMPELVVRAPSLQILSVVNWRPTTVRSDWFSLITHSSNSPWLHSQLPNVYRHIKRPLINPYQ
jgi:F-box/TPR repeat protein Pof3